MVTLEEIKKSIEDGKCTKVYSSSKTLWWTHSPIDLKEASEKGSKFITKCIEKLLHSGNIQGEGRNKLRMQLKILKLGHKLPLDPTGAPLMEMDTASWLRYVEQMKEDKNFHLFMKAHHQNCNGYVFTKLDDYKNIDSDN